MRFRRLSYATLVLGLLTYGFILSIRPDSDALSVPPDWPLQTLSSPEPASKVSIPRPERSPHESLYPDTILYVVNQGISPKWGFEKVFNVWQKAKWTQLQEADECPVASFCVIISETNIIQSDLAGQTDYYSNGQIKISLNSLIVGKEAQNTMCHEFGHALGIGHLKGSNDSCMPATGVYRTLPTLLDLQMVDSLGPWELRKMAHSAEKTVDVTAQPN